MACITRTSAVNSAYTAGAGATTFTVTTAGSASTLPKAGDVAIAVISATGTARASQYPLLLTSASLAAGWTLAFRTSDNIGPQSIVATRTLTADGNVSVSASDPGADSGIHGGIVVVAGGSEAISVTLNSTNKAVYTGTAGATSTSVTSPASSAVAPVGSLPITWHASYYLTTTSAAWSTTLPTGKVTWQPTTVADTAIAGLATYAVTTTAATFASRAAVLAAARNSGALTIIVPQSTAAQVSFVGSRVANPGPTNGVWVNKPPGAAPDDEPSCFRFLGQSTARQRVIVQRFAGVHPTAPILSSGFGANTTTAATSHVAPDLVWSPNSMLVDLFTTASSQGGYPTQPTGMTLDTNYAYVGTSVEEVSWYQAYSSGLTSGTRTAVYAVSAVWNSAGVVLRPADSGGPSAEVLIAWHSQDASQSQTLMDTAAWNGWTLLATLARAGSTGAASIKIYYQIVDPVLHETTWTSDTDQVLGNNENTNPACLIDGTNWTNYNSSLGTGGRVTDIVGMARSTGYRLTKITSPSALGVFAGNTMTVTPGEVVTLSAELKCSVSSAYTQLYAWFVDSGGALVSYVKIPIDRKLQPGVSQRLVVTATAPSGCVGVRALAWVDYVPVGAIFEVTASRYQRGSFATLPYLDGDVYRCMWTGTRGASISQRNLTAFPDMSTATLGTQIGFEGTQRQEPGTTNISGPVALPVEAAPFGRPGLAVRADLATQSQRAEHNPSHRSFLTGDDYWFGFAFALPLGYPTWVQDFMVIEQLHGAPGNGSPVISFETREYSLRLRGGDNKPGASPTNLYAYAITLLNNLKVGRWYNVVYHVVFSDQNGGGSVDVWVDGDQKLAGFAPPGATVWGTDVASDGGPTYRKCGLYKRYTLEGGGPGLQPWHAGVALGHTYGGVDPTRDQLPATSAFVPSSFF